MRQSRVMFSLSLSFLLYPAMRLCSAATFTCGSGDVACLIAAMTAANRTPEPDTIRLAAGTYLLTAVDNITDTDGANGLPSVTGPLTLQGAGADQSMIARPPSVPMFRLLHVAPTGVLTVQGLTMTGGRPGFVSSSNMGGGIRNEGTIVLTASRLEENAAEAGGGLANFGGQVTIEHSELVGNMASHPGGGVYTVGGAVTIRQSTFAENLADGGGAIDNDDGTVLITNSMIVDNNGAYTGTGGIGNFFGVLRVTNTTIARNTVVPGDGRGGGALSVSGGDALLTNCTVVDNTTPRGVGPGGISRTAGVLALHNTIVARNTGLRGSDCAGVITSEGHNLIGDPTGCAVMWQPTDLTGNPGVDAYLDDGQPGHGHYPLLEDSPLIDAGDDRACLATDQLGNHRAGPCDIGAIEFQPPAAPPALAITLNQTDFAPGQTLRMALEMRNPGPMRTTDHYVGVILPDGQTVLWLTNTAPLEGVVTRLDADPRMFTPMLRNASWPAALDVTQEGYLSYRFTGGEAPGIYHLLVGWTKPGSLADGRIDKGDVLALDWKAIQFTVPAGTLAAQARD